MQVKVNDYLRRMIYKYYAEHRTNKELKAENEKFKVVLGEKDLEIAGAR